MEYTTNLNLKKPDVNEYYDIEKNNENMDLIDTAVGELNSQVGTETLTTTAKNCTGAINELNKKFGGQFGNDVTDILPITSQTGFTVFTNWSNKTDFPDEFGSGIILPAKDAAIKHLIYIVDGHFWIGTWKEYTGEISWTEL